MTDEETLPVEEEIVEEVQEEEPEEVVAEEVSEEEAALQAEIDALEAEQEIQSLSEFALGILTERLREGWLAEFTEAAQAQLKESFIPEVKRRTRKRLIPVESITELRFDVEGSDTIFYLDENKPGAFILRVFHNPGR